MMMMIHIIVPMHIIITITITTNPELVSGDGIIVDDTDTMK